MTYHLAIGDRAYSSWSLRGWLLFDAFGLPVSIHRVRLYSDPLQQLLAEFAPARTVPVLRIGDAGPGAVVVAETIAITEELASRHPDAGIWPKDPNARAVARALAAEMHAGFGALRNHCPMNLRVSYANCTPPDAALADLARLDQIWDWARVQTRATGPWLCGAYSAADAFFAPIAARIAGYNLPVSPASAAYTMAHLAHPSFRRWRAMGHADGPDQPVYQRDWPQRPWPGPARLPARAVDGTGSENAACPYSGKPVTNFLEIDGRRFGFCNTFCRDKTVADPAAWPAFMNLYQS